VFRLTLEAALIKLNKIVNGNSLLVLFTRLAIKTFAPEALHILRRCKREKSVQWHNKMQ